MNSTPVRINPFPGLRPFTQDEDYLFFGREEQTIELLQRLGNNRFVAVVGSSGSGKSSLVRCGLLSELLGGRLLEAGAAWDIAVMHPGGNPLALLTEALLEADLYAREDENARENLLATLSRSHFGLVEAVKQADIGEATNFLLVVDQFEEIFRFHEAGQQQQEAANEFVSLLLEAAAQKEIPIYIVLTMRSDFIGECAQFESLAERVNRGEFLIPRLTREQYKRVIEGPIKVAGGKIAPRLLQRLLNDLGQQADQLPCLQHALMRTWNVWAAQGDAEALDLDDYQRVGKMSQALSLHADEIYESLASDRQRDLCRGMFQALTVEESNSRGIRRPQRLGRLCQILEVSADELRPVIDAYRQSGVTFLMPSPEVELIDQTIIDISHESLMRVWTRLRQWVEEETQAAGIYFRLSESADLNERGKAGLYRDPELGIALAWRDVKNPNTAWAERYRPGFVLAMNFLDASHEASISEEASREAARNRELQQAQDLAESQQLRLEQQQRAAQKLQKLIVGVTVVAIIAGVACVAALVARNEASKLAHIAASAADKARTNEDRAKANEKLAGESQQDTVKALAVVESQKSEVESSLIKAQRAEEEGRKLLYTTDMRLAPFVWNDDRATAQKLRTLLAKHIPLTGAGGENEVLPIDERPDLRGFEWYFYQHLLDNSATVFSGHTKSVVAAAFTSNGQLVTVEQEGQAHYWNLGSQEEEKGIRRDLLISRIASIPILSPDGRLTAFADENHVYIFETSTGKELVKIDSRFSDHKALIFTHDSQRLVIADEKIRWYEADSGRLIATFDHACGRGGLGLSSDGLTLAVVGNGGVGNLFSIFKLDAMTKTVTQLVKDAGKGGTFKSCSMSADGKLLAASYSLSASVTVHDTVTGEQIAEHRSAHPSPVAKMIFSSDSLKLVTADIEGTIKVWDNPTKLTSKSAAWRTLKGHEASVTHVGFSLDGKQLVSASADKTARIWDMERPGAAIIPLERAGTGCYQARFSANAELIASADGNSVRLWESVTGKLVRVLSAGGKERVYSVAFSPTDCRLLAVGYGGEADISYVGLWDIDSGVEIARLTGATDIPEFIQYEEAGFVGALAFSPDGKYLVAGFGSPRIFRPTISPNPLKVWEVTTRRLVRRLSGHSGFCFSLDFSKDGTHLASGSRDGTTIIWSTATWKAMQRLENPIPDPSGFGQPGKGIVDDVAFSPDGLIVAVAGFEGNVQLWDVAKGTLLDTLRGHSNSVTAVVFSPDGRTLATGGGDQAVRLWNVATRRELMQLDTGNVELGRVDSLVFSPDGTHLLAAGRNSTAFWSTVPIVWNNPIKSAILIEQLLKSNADFQRRIRMFSENVRLHEGLERIRTNDLRVSAALAASQANWHASQEAWPEAVAAFDRLLSADPTTPANWLRTPGLLRVSRALLIQNRPREAASLLTGGAMRRNEDGLPVAEDRITLGISFSTINGQARVNEVLANSLALQSNIRAGDVIVKVDDAELNPASLKTLDQLLAGQVGTKVQLTLRHAENDQTEVTELVREQIINDSSTGKLLDALRKTLNQRLAQEPRNPALLELRAELAGQWSDSKAQLADYSAAIKALEEQANDDASATLRRLYGRRGNAHVKLNQWSQAVDDYARGVTAATTDESLLSGQALAQAEALSSHVKWTVLKPVEAKSELGATLSVRPDMTILASGGNFTNDRYRIVVTVPTDIELAAVRLEALRHESLPGGGPGRGESPKGTFYQVSWSVTATLPNYSDSIRLDFDDAWANRQYANFPINANGYWNIFGNQGENCAAFWSKSKPIALPAGSTLTFDMQCSDSGNKGENLGHFRLSMSGDPAAIDQEQKSFAVAKLNDPWQKLAEVYRIRGDQNAIDQLVSQRPRLASLVGDLFIQDEDWYRAVEIYSRGITAATIDADLFSKRARAYEGLANWDAAAADWSRAAKGNPEGVNLLAEFARRLAAGDQLALADSQFKKANALYGNCLEADSDNELTATELGRLLLDWHEIKPLTHWTVLTPVEAKSELGATMTILPDDSVLASGANPTNDHYRVLFTVPTRIDLAAVRLEALTHDSLPFNGPGRGKDPMGTFYQISWAVSATLPDANPSIGLDFDDAIANRQYNPFPTKRNGHWNIFGNQGKNCTAIWSRLRPVDLPSGSILTFEMQCSDSGEKGENLGRFRLSISDDLASIDGERKFAVVERLTNPWEKLAALYYLRGDQGALERTLNDHPVAAGGLGELYALEHDWNRIVREYSKVITPQSKNVQLLAKRAQAYEKLEKWDFALADWTRASQLQPDVAFDRFKSVDGASFRLDLNSGAAGSMEVMDGTLVFTTTATTGVDWHVQAFQAPLQLENGEEYVIRFKMKSPDSCRVTLIAGIDQADWHSIGLNETFDPPPEFKDYEFTFVVHDVVRGKNRIGLQLGRNRGKVLVREIVILKKRDVETLRDVDSVIKQAAAHVSQGHWGLALVEWRRAVAQQPNQMKRAFDQFLKAHRWNEAAEFGLQLIKQNRNDSMEWLRIAPVMALADDQAAYSEFCGRMVRQFTSSKLPVDLERVVKSTLLRANSIDLADLPGAELANLLDVGTPTEGFLPWGWAARALLAYRSGDFESTVKYVVKSEAHNPHLMTHALNLTILAIAEYQLQHSVDAKVAFEEAAKVVTLLQDDQGNNGEHDLLIAQILFREAEKLINGKHAD